VAVSSLRNYSSLSTTTRRYALDDHPRNEQTRALLDLLADYVQKLDKENDSEP
jgi:hypothetical protein